MNFVDLRVSFRNRHLFFVLAIRLKNEIAHAILGGRIGNRPKQRETSTLAIH